MVLSAKLIISALNPTVTLSASTFESHFYIMRWALALQSYNFKVEHIKGKENVAADFLSRAVE